MSAIRRLAAILAADVVGYSRLIGADEGGTLQAFKSIRAELFEPTIATHNGRLVKTTGDGFLVEFSSVVDALCCGIELQAGMVERNTGIRPDRRIDFRICIHQGDIVVEDGDIFGDGVNVAARLEGLAEPGRICVSARVQEDAAGRLDVAFEDMGEQALKNIARPIRAYRVVSAGDAAPTRVTPGPALPDEPSIAVLPFANMSGDPEQEYFADGMVEEIITALSRIRWLFVIARKSAFTYKGQAIDVKQVGRELGVRYVLEGSVRKASGRMRITAQLIDAVNGAHLWTDRFDGSLEDVFDLQDEVAIAVAGVIEPTLQAAEVRRSAGRPTDDLTAYDLFLRALPIYSSLSKEGVGLALELLERALELDPGYGPAMSFAARCHLRFYLDGWATDLEMHCARASDLARRALEIARDDPVVIADAAYVLAEVGENIEAMIALINRALALNPSYARGWFRSGALRVHAGEADLAIEHVETSLRLSPRERLGVPFSVIGSAHFFAGRLREATPKLLVAIQEHPSHPWPFRFLASCYAHMGRLDEARDIIERLRAFTPVVVPSHIPWRKPEHRDLLLSGLRLAASCARPAVSPRSSPLTWRGSRG
jgi:adenylate cyclase